MSKPGKVLKGLCKKLGVRLTVKRGKKRVYKSVKVLKAQCKKAASKKKKKVKRRRRSKFGPGPVNPATPLRESADAPTPGKLMSPPQWETSPHILPENSSPSGVSPFMMRLQRRRRRRSTGIRAGPPPRFNLDQFGKKKKKKVKRRRKFGQAPFRDFLEAPPLIRQRAQQPIDLEDRNDFNEDQIRNDPERDARIIRILYARGVPEDLHGIILRLIRENQ